jgi:hypothetical protein
MDSDQTLVVQETEYTGAGKHVQAQLSFARENGINVSVGDPREEQAGTSIILPEDPSLIRVKDFELQELVRSYIRRSLEFARQLDRQRGGEGRLRMDEGDINFLAQETRRSPEEVRELIAALDEGSSS